MSSPDWYEELEQECRKTEDLCTLLDTAIDLLDDMKGYVPEYFREKWGYDFEIQSLKEHYGRLQ